MKYEMIILRILHILVGMFWAGSAFFIVSFLLPAIRKGTPTGRAIARQLVEGGFIRAIPAVALVTVLAGIRLYWLVSSNFDPKYTQSATGICFGAGGLFGLAALIHGATMVGPRAKRLGAVAAAESATPGGQSPWDAPEGKRAIADFVSAVQWTVRIVGAAALLMAIGRYV